MAAPAVVLVVAMAIALAGANIPNTGHPAELEPKPLEGKVTASTFTLKQPRCEFNVSNTDRIWLVVARSEAVNNFVNPNSSQEAPSYQSFANESYQSFANNSYYMTLSASVLNYPCSNLQQASEEYNILRVGNDTSCRNDTLRPDCNGPLPGPGPYRVKFLAMNSAGPIAESGWSDDIKLIQAKDPNTIDTQPRRRSSAMIAITTILSILFAILLATLIATLVYKYTDICGHANIASVKNTPTATRYTTHHMYDQPGHMS